MNFAKSPNQVLQDTGFLPERYPKRLHLLKPRHWLLFAMSSLPPTSFSLSSLIMACFQIDQPFNRRHFLNSAGAGFGAVALSALANEPLLARASNNPTLPKIPHNWGKAKNVIFLFMEGG